MGRKGRFTRLQSLGDTWGKVCACSVRPGKLEPKEQQGKGWQRSCPSEPRILCQQRECCQPQLRPQAGQVAYPSVQVSSRC